MLVESLEVIIDDSHAMVSTSVGSEHYVSFLSFVDEDLLGPGCSVLLSHEVHAVIGVLMDDTDPWSVMKVEKAPLETCGDTGGLDNQIQEIKESVELPLTHPEYYEEMVSIMFIEEIDAIGTKKRYDSNSGGGREIRRRVLNC
uniref:Proteasomal ATPase second OB domain-containing protein n=1 Tax=Molossus molossus TaxID=27622 RepID=A0A7J8C8Y1_MOLMO|nr:hypothetical protein HJG59_009924 [Molossus molossus]